MTLHAALSLNQHTVLGTKGKTRRDLVAMWEGVDYLFIDEVSIIGCNFSLKISEALTEAKQKTSAFGGMNIIFAGDFTQLPPVRVMYLFAHINIAKANTKRGQDDILGKLLWLSVKTVVVLNQVMHQRGPKNDQFVSLLTCLHQGKCSDHDFETLNSRIVKNAKPDWQDPAWNRLPVIISDNAVKDALNERGAELFAQKTGRQMHWYYATDTRSGKEVMDLDLKAHFQSLHSGKTNQQLTRIPLVLGMPVMILQNFDIEAGVVNGCTGTLKRINTGLIRKGIAMCSHALYMHLQHWDQLYPICQSNAML